MSVELALACTYHYSIGDMAQYDPLFDASQENELLDRLCRRYVRYEDIQPTMDLLEQVLPALPLAEDSRRRFWEAYDDCLGNVKNYGGKNGELYGKEGCRPIRIININGSNAIFYVVMETDLPLEEYDELEGAPFWADPKYLEERVRVCSIRDLFAKGRTLSEIAELYKHELSEEEILELKRRGEHKPPHE